MEWRKFATLEMKRDWSQMRPAIVSGIVIGEAHSDIGEFVFPVPAVTVPEVWKIWTQEPFHK